MVSLNDWLAPRNAIASRQLVPQLFLSISAGKILEAEGAGTYGAIRLGWMVLMEAWVQAMITQEGVLAVQTEPFMMDGASRSNFITRPGVRMLKNAARTSHDLPAAPVIHPLVDEDAGFCTAAKVRKLLEDLACAKSPSSHTRPNIPKTS